MEGRLLLGSGFRRMLIGQLVIRNFEGALQAAAGADAIWATVRDAAKELGFDRVEMELQGTAFSECFDAGRAGAEWTAEVPLSGGGYVRLTRPFDSQTHQAAMGPFLDTLRKVLAAKQMSGKGPQRSQAAGV